MRAGLSLEKKVLNESIEVQPLIKVIFKIALTAIDHERKYQSLILFLSFLKTGNFTKNIIQTQIDCTTLLSKILNYNLTY